MDDYGSGSTSRHQEGEKEEGHEEEANAGSLAVLPDSWTSSRREVGGEGVWTISSAKPGNGVEQLRDGSTETYWQSDGTQPHSVTIQFLRKVAVSEICLYLDFSLDESYAPKKIAVRAGSTEADLVELAVLELTDPVGWTTIPLSSCGLDLPTHPLPPSQSPPLRAHLLQLQVLTMHQNGRDTHVRQVKVFGPRASPSVMGGVRLDHFHSLDLTQHALLR